MEETPPIPPAVAGQMGGGGEKPPFSGVGSMMASKPAAPAPPGGGGAQPMGALKSAADAVTKVIDNMATMDKEGAPYAARIKQMLQSWTAEAAKRGPGGRSMSPSPEMAKPPEAEPAGGPGFVG